jgi:hypothetical protein
LNDIDRRCDAYLTWLDNKRRWVGPFHQQILDTQTATTAIMAATLVDPTKAIAVVGAAFGFAAHSFTNFNNRFLFEVEKSTVQSVVLTRQQQYRQGLPAVINNRPAAIYALRQYLRLCMPMTIETQINTTVKLFERAGPQALSQARARPMIDPKTVQSANIRVNFAPVASLGIRLRDFFNASSSNKQEVERWMREQGITMPFAFFIRAPEQAENRRRMARDLNIP